MSAGSEVLEDEDMFQGIMDDLATLHVLGVKLVILASVRFQVDRRLQVETGDVGAVSYTHLTLPTIYTV